MKGAQRREGKGGPDDIPLSIWEGKGEREEVRREGRMGHGGTGSRASDTDLSPYVILSK